MGKKIAVLATFLMIAWSLPAFAADGVHRVVLQITDNDPQKMNTVLNVASNVTRHYESLGEQVEVAVVAFNLGLHMLRADTSPDKVRQRLSSFSQSMPNLSFRACNNTWQAMKKREGKDIPLVDSAVVVPSGAVELILCAVMAG